MALCFCATTTITSMPAILNMTINGNGNNSTTPSSASTTTIDKGSKANSTINTNGTTKPKSKNKTLIHWRIKSSSKKAYIPILINSKPIGKRTHQCAQNALLSIWGSNILCSSNASGVHSQRLRLNICVAIAVTQNKNPYIQKHNIANQVSLP